MTEIAHIDEQALPAFAEATVSDVMSAGIISCSPETPLRVVARVMANFGVHSVFVFEHRDEDDEDRQFWGVVSDLDLVAASPVIDERDAGSSAVTPIVTVRGDEPLADAAELMARRNIAHLAVVDPASGRPVGVISTIDIARALAAEISERENRVSARA